ncbi:MAG: hypothetical protein AAFS07_18815 [Pseudomonadota bacterium]
MVLLLLAAVNWFVVLVNYNAADIQGGSYGGVVPDLIATFFKLPPDGINKKDRTSQQSYLQACQGVQAFVYALVGLAAIIGFTKFGNIHYSKGTGKWAAVLLALVLVGAINWLVTLVNMFAFKTLDGSTSGYTPDLLYLLARLSGPDKFRSDPFPTRANPAAGDTVPDAGALQALSVSQQIVYALVFIAAIALVVLRMRNGDLMK